MTDVVYGLTPTGFVPKTRVIIRGDFDADARAAYGKSFKLGDRTLAGHLGGIVANAAGLCWDLAQATDASQDPDGATQAALDQLCALTGTIRIPAAESTTVGTLCGVPLSVVTAGSRAKTASTAAVFRTLADGTILALVAWAPTHAYVSGATIGLGNRVTNTNRCYECIASGTSAGSVGPITTADDITDGTVHWRYLGEGIGAVDVDMKSLDTGEVVALSGDLTKITTPVAGWQSVRNLLDAKLGHDVETDEDLRVRREAELATVGVSTADAIVGALLETDGVTTATVFENDTDVIDANGQAPHSVQVLVLGGDDTEIAAVLYAKVAAGIATIGTTGVVVTDSQGQNHTISFTRPAAVPIYVDVTLTYNPEIPSKGGYPVDGDTQIKQVIAVYGNAQNAGRNAVPRALAAQPFAALPTAILDIDVLVFTDVIGTPVAWGATTAYVATPGSRSVVTNDGGRKYICITSGTSAGSGGPTGTSADITDGTVHWCYLGNAVTVDPFHQATYDTSRITVHSSAGTP